MDGIKVRIIKNLKERVHPVNDQTALSGIDDLTAGQTALRELTLDGTVDIDRVNVAMPDQKPQFRTLYMLSYDARMKAAQGLRRVK